MRNAKQNRAPANPTRENIEAIAKLEHDALKNRTYTERVSEAIAKLIGSVPFLLFNVGLIALWTSINLKLIPAIPVFDPFPFGGLALVLSTESVFLTVFVLMSQNRMVRQADRRSHLDLQISLLTEQELTAVLLMLQKLCNYLGVNVDSSKDFAKATDVNQLVNELEEKLPDQ
jgi:uncharacterized membrane protein